MKIWNDEKFREFTDDGKLAFLFLLTHPSMTSMGAMRATVAGLAAEMGWEQPRMSSALEPALKFGMLVMNIGAAFIWVPKFLSYNEPESPNVVRSWPTQFELIPECEQKRTALFTAERLCQSLGEGFAKAFGEAFGEALPKGYPHPSPNPEPEPEPEPKPKESKAGAHKPRPTFVKPTALEVSEYSKAKGKPIDGEAFVAFYESKGWVIGTSPMRNWKAAVVTWQKRGNFNGRSHANAAPGNSFRNNPDDGREIRKPDYENVIL